MFLRKSEQIALSMLAVITVIAGLAALPIPAIFFAVLMTAFFALCAFFVLHVVLWLLPENQAVRRVQRQRKSRISLAQKSPVKNPTRWLSRAEMEPMSQYPND